MKEVDLGATAPTYELSYPQPPPLTRRHCGIYAERSEQEEEGRPGLLFAFIHTLLLEVDSERTSWVIWNVMMGIYSR